MIPEICASGFPTAGSMWDSVSGIDIGLVWPELPSLPSPIYSGQRKWSWENTLAASELGANQFGAMFMAIVEPITDYLGIPLELPSFPGLDDFDLIEFLAVQPSEFYDAVKQAIIDNGGELLPEWTFLPDPIYPGMKSIDEDVIAVMGNITREYWKAMVVYTTELFTAVIDFINNIFDPSPLPGLPEIPTLPTGEELKELISDAFCAIEPAICELKQHEDLINDLANVELTNNLKIYSAWEPLRAEFEYFVKNPGLVAERLGITNPIDLAAVMVEVRETYDLLKSKTMPVICDVFGSITIPGFPAVALPCPLVNNMTMPDIEFNDQLKNFLNDLTITPATIFTDYIEDFLGAFIPFEFPETCITPALEIPA